MFTGIVQEVAPVTSVIRKGDATSQMIHYSVQLSPERLQGLEIGASISINGTCQTVVKIDGNQVFFDAIQETLQRTNLVSLEVGQSVNLERAARFGDEIGGHVLSGHVYGQVKLVQLEQLGEQRVLKFECSRQWIKYFFSKGFIALDGISLTLVDVDPQGFFSVHLIPETLRKTTLGDKTVGAWINVEIDAQTQAIVETVERILESSS